MIGFTCRSAWRWKPGMGLRIGKEPVKVYQYRTCNRSAASRSPRSTTSWPASLKGADDASVMFAGLDGKAVCGADVVQGLSAVACPPGERRRNRRNSWFWRLWS